MSEQLTSSQQRYLELLGARSPKALENRIVTDVLSAYGEKVGPEVVPVRLSRVAERFLVSPRPELIVGRHDGEIDFDDAQGTFVIKLCTNLQPATLAELRDQSRLRFTYAHEMAHRFFYVPFGGSWARARDIATADLILPEQMKAKITLGRLEEGLCNSIARRVLVPDEFLNKHCIIEEWFDKGEQLYALLSRAAQRCGVSKDCLLVRLETSSRKTRKNSNFVFIIGKSSGPIIKRTTPTLRIVSAIFPTIAVGREVPKYYPGIEWAKFGEAAVAFVSDKLYSDNSLSGRIELPVCVRRHPAQLAQLIGWWRRLRRESGVESERIMIWGSLD